ncbi:hypothetical protein ACH5RR_030443 [Cinchona calisaya]|uniref:Uncharacterized protein n=1 Tax=Cinchona calisaya TaxID=153742 RepID=A0ABD2YXU2_9GENT
MLCRPPPTAPFIHSKQQLRFSLPDFSHFLFSYDFVQPKKISKPKYLFTTSSTRSELKIEKVCIKFICFALNIVLGLEKLHDQQNQKSRPRNQPPPHYCSLSPVPSPPHFPTKPLFLLITNQDNFLCI